MNSPAQKKRSKPKKLLLRVRELMAENGIRNITELKAKLEEVGVKLSNAQLGRVVDNSPTKLDRDLLSGLIHIFQCNPGDLFTTE